MSEAAVNQETRMTRKDLNKIYWRLQLFGVGLSIQSTTAQAISFAYCTVPVLNKIYKDAPKEQRVNAMKRHLEYFLSQNTATGMILGICAALEETTTEDEKDAIVAVKAGMMGPLAGIGDSVFKLTIQAIAGSVGAVYALQGNLLGAILMFVIYNGINIAIKYGGIILGYQKGMEFITSGDQAKLMNNIINLATMVGVIVLGCLISSSVKLNIAYVLTVEETTVPIQSLIDSALPNLLPLLATLGLYLINKKMPRKYMIVLIFAILIIGTLLALAGIIG